MPDRVVQLSPAESKDVGYVQAVGGRGRIFGRRGCTAAITFRDRF